MNEWMNLKRADIEHKLKDILSRGFGISPGGWTESRTRSNLLSRDFLLLPSDLLFLFFEIEKEFGIKIPQEAVVSGKFNSFQNIIEVIQAQLTSSSPSV
jgi:acyl carrier protein